MKDHFVKTLGKQLPLLIKNKVIDEETARNIELYYENQSSGSSRNTVLTIISSIAALLIGSGIILLFAYNWNTIPRILKTIIAFIPLVSGQILVYLSWSHKKNTPWIESSSLFLSLAVGAVIALISQIYQIPGNLENFLFIWMILILPLNYLTGSTGTLAIYLTGILFWSGFSQEAGGHAAYYWLLLGAVIPKLILLMKNERYSNKTSIVSWLVVINLLIGTGITLEKVIPGLWILVYSLLLISLYLIGRIYKSEPFKIIGTSGTVILSYIFTFEFFWEEIGFNNISRQPGRYENIAIIDYAMLIFLFIFASYLLIKKIEKSEIKEHLPFLIISILSLCSFLLGSIIDVIIPQTIIFNLYTLFLGGWIISRGLKNKYLYQINLGMLTVLLIIVTRFFDMDIGFTVKGIIFILLGTIFLVINKYLGKRL